MTNKESRVGASEFELHLVPELPPSPYRNPDRPFPHFEIPTGPFPIPLMAAVARYQQVHYQRAQDAIDNAMDEDDSDMEYIPPSRKRDREGSTDSEEEKKKKKKKGKGKKGSKAKELVRKEGPSKEWLNELMSSIGHLFKTPMKEVSTVVVQSEPVHSTDKSA